MTFPPDNGPRRRRLLAGLAAAGLAVAAFGAGDAHAGDPLYNPHVRVDEVVDSNGEPWTVLIVPRVFNPPCHRPLGPVGVLHVPAASAPAVNAPLPSLKASSPAVEDAASSGAGKVFTSFQAAAEKPSKDKDGDRKKDADRKKDTDRKKEADRKEEAARKKEADRKERERQRAEEQKKRERRERARQERERKPADEPEVVEEAKPEVVEADGIDTATFVPADHVSMGRPIDPHDYWRIYTSLPFVRSEYDANPSYRHEATMEILFGQMRPTVNVKQQAPPVRREVVSPLAARAAFGYDLFPDGYAQFGPFTSQWRPWGTGYPGAYWTLPPYFGSSRLSGFSYLGGYGNTY
jgi:hypothetical protein